MSWTGQAHEETNRTDMSLIHFIQIKYTRLQGIGHGEQHVTVATHTLVTVENIHIAKAQATFQNALV